MPQFSLSIPEGRKRRVQAIKLPGAFFTWKRLDLTIASEDEVLARRAVAMVRCEAEREDWNRFISLPLKPIASTLSNLNAFWQAVREQIPQAESMINPLGKLHLTVAVIWAVELEPVKELLRTLSIKPFEINLVGLGVMVGSPEQAQVLYAEIAPNQTLKDIESDLLPKLCDLGVTSRVTVSWHCTLLNAVYAMRRLHLRHMPLFDARSLLAQFGRFHFGPVQVDSLELCFFSQHRGHDRNHYETDFIKELS